MEADTKKGRGRPRTFKNTLYAIYSDKEKRTAQNLYYAGDAVMILGQKPGDFFVSAKGKLRRQSIAEQIGRMHIQDGYSETDCKTIAEKAIALYENGFPVKTIETMIRHGRTTGQW